MRKRAMMLLTALCGAVLIWRGGECAAAAREAVGLCLQTVIPSLFPFFVVSSLLVELGAGELLGWLLRGMMRPLFGLGRGGAAALALGALGGYPVGARTLGELYRRGEVSREEAEQLLAFCNNSGPGFILGICGGAVFRSAEVGIWLYLIHIAAALMTGILLRRNIPFAAAAPLRRRENPRFAAVFPLAVGRAFAGIGNVCSFVILFAVPGRLLGTLPAMRAASPCVRSVLCGAVELTGGITALPCSAAGFVCCALLLGWGGASVHAQTLAVLDGSGLSVRRYFIGKALHAALSAAIAAIVCRYIF